MVDPVGRLSRIAIYPLKSLDGIVADEALVLESGALEDDRRWRLVDHDGRVVNAKRTARLHAVRAEFDLAARRVRLRVEPAAAVAHSSLPTPDEFPLVPGPDGPCAWLAEVLGFPVLLEERPAGGFPDDRDAPGATLAASATLDAVAGWFGFAAEEARRRFRVNLEVAGPGAFWEDTLAAPARPERQAGLEPADPYAAAPPAEPRRFSIAGQSWLATGVCRRCPVPARDSGDGREDPLFRTVFEARRRVALRRDVDARDWGHLYRLAINTRGLSDPGLIRLGDPVAVAPRP